MTKSLRDIARAVRHALAERNLVDIRVDAPDPEQLDEKSLEGARTFAAEAEDILAKRAIVAVATDRSKGKVVIYTSRPYAQRDQGLILEDLDEDFPIIFRSLDLGVQGPGTGLIDGLPKPVMKDGRIACGTSISLANDRGAGTLGALVRDRGGQLFGLSCSHVIAGCGYMQVGMPILSPGVQDIVPSWPDPRVIGHFSRSLPLVAGDPRTIGDLSNLDAAIFRVADEDSVSSSQGGVYDTPAAIHDLKEEDEGELEIEKFGRTTGHSEGTIGSQFDHAIEIAFSVTSYPEHGHTKKFEATVFTNALWLASSSGAPFARPGDSGALVVTRIAGSRSRKAVGLVIAGTRDNSALVLPIRPILKALDVSLVAKHGA